MNVRSFSWYKVIILATAFAVSMTPFAARARDEAILSSPNLDTKICQLAIQLAERSARLPSQLLEAIGTVESGRLLAGSGHFVSWPWTINVGGTGYFFDTKDEAIAAVRGYQAKGVQSIDVGCLQVNLSFHPTAFASLDQAFDPMSNANYAAAFLSRLFAQSHGWATAAAAYHSQTPGVSDGYVRRVITAWPMAIRYMEPSVLAALVTAPGTGLRQSSGHPSRTCAQHDISDYTPEFKKVIAQAMLDHTRIIMAMGSSNLTPATKDCSLPQAMPQQTRARSTSLTRYNG